MNVYTANGWYEKGSNINALTLNYPTMKYEEKTNSLLSFVMRIHNEEETLKESVQSLYKLNFPFEIVLILHRCTDNSFEIANKLKKEIDEAIFHVQIKIVIDNVQISRAGLETFITPSKSIHSFVNYTTRSFSHATSLWKIKWDGDFVATDSFIHYLNEHSERFKSFIPQVIRVNAVFNNGHKQREYWGSNCLLKYGKQYFWEIPIWTHKFVNTWEFPDHVTFLHKTTLESPKDYWCKKPWFLNDNIEKESKELKNKWEEVLEKLNINDFEKMPIGIARACNPECDSFLLQCKKVLNCVE